MSWIKVLVASSDAEKRVALIDILTQSGLEPVTASSLEEVRTILRQKEMHVIFCENDLPDGSFREALRVKRESYSPVHIVVSSMLGDLDEYLEAMNLGAFDFIAPPYRTADIISIIDNACAHLKPREATMFYVQAETPRHGGKAVA